MVKMIDAPLFVSLFISSLTEFQVAGAFAEHGVVDASNFVRGGGYRLLATAA